MSYLYRIGTGASQDRLEKLIEERLRPGADKAAVDRRIWDLFGETWAVMFTDLAGFSRKVAEFGIIHFLQVIYESQRILVPCIEAHDGILLKTEGDSFLVIFRSPSRALDCAVAMQRAVRDYNQGRSGEEEVLLCVGLGFGPMLRIGDRDVFGAEVNAAAKLGEDTAQAGEILVTGAVAAEIRGKPELRAKPEVSLEPLSVVPPGAREAFRVRYKL
ncbi:MAG: adenylate/guanylate cyclase domain-containing protein [Spirochaetales bacterium]|nr:adenylate/guanylate cyclase domain-containing protein [Spirochaetales bacterium]